MNTLRHTPRRSRQAGFTLVEMMVAVTIGMIVLFGMTATFVNLKNTFRSQDKLGTLQDNERLALTFLTNSINEAGYYPDPKSASTITASVAPTTSPASPGGTMPAGAGVFGTADGGAATSPESLQTAYASLSTDGLISCIGTSYAGSATVAATVRNIYYVDPTTNSLMCRVLVNGLGTDAMANAGTPQVLVTGVSKMAVLYGLAPAGSMQVNEYVSPGTVTAWNTVKAVRITLNFVNPFGGADIVRTHTINVMNSN